MILAARNDVPHHSPGEQHFIRHSSFSSVTVSSNPNRTRNRLLSRLCSRSSTSSRVQLRQLLNSNSRELGTSSSTMSF